MPMIELSEQERAKFKEAAMGARDTFLELGGDDAQRVLDSLTAEIEGAEMEMQED